VAWDAGAVVDLNTRITDSSWELAEAEAYGSALALIVPGETEGCGFPALEAMDLTVRRNAFGRQVDSFEADLHVPALGDPPFHAVFIRAPVIEDVGRGVEILARLKDGTPVAARQGRLFATAFHPELTGDRRFHQLFIASAAR
jgi:5'-phosphate synthase pdxT subunit